MGKAPLPILRRFGTVHVFEKRLGVAHESGSPTIFGSERAFFRRDVFFSPATEAQPGVVDSPGTI